MDTERGRDVPTHFLCDPHRSGAYLVAEIVESREADPRRWPRESDGCYRHAVHVEDRRGHATDVEIQLLVVDRRIRVLATFSRSAISASSDVMVRIVCARKRLLYDAAQARPVVAMQ